MRLLHFVAILACVALSEGRRVVPRQTNRCLDPALCWVPGSGDDSSTQDQIDCIEKCDAGDVNCQSQCIAVPSPGGDATEATTKCVAECDEGDGSSAATERYSECVQQCIQTWYYSMSSDSVPAATGVQSTSSTIAGATTSPLEDVSTTATGTVSGDENAQTRTSSNPSETGSNSGSSTDGGSGGGGGGNGMALGLGVGLGVGIPLTLGVIAIIWFLVWKTKRLERRLDAKTTDANQAENGSRDAELAGAVTVRPKGELVGDVPPVRHELEGDNERAREK